MPPRQHNLWRTARGLPDDFHKNVSPSGIGRCQGARRGSYTGPVDERHDDLTRMIGDARLGDASAKQALYDRIHAELRAIAGRTPRAGRAGDTLQPTVIVNELFVEFERRFPPPPADIPESRATFFRTVALAMRTICRDYWRAQSAKKRGGGVRPVQINEQLDADSDDLMSASDFLDLDDALSRLETFNPRWFEVVMHRYFAGRTIQQTAELLNMAESSVSADWQLARAWLRKELTGRRA